MKKKIFAAALGLMLALSIAACSSAPDSETSVPATTLPQTTTAPATTVPQTTEKEESEFTQIVLADNDEVCIKITGIENDPIWGYTLKVFLENKTDKELMFTVDDVSVNGFMCDPFWAESVAAGKKSNSTISWSETSFAENGITQVADITLTLRVYDSNDFMAEDVLEETFIIQP